MNDGIYYFVNVKISQASFTWTNDAVEYTVDDLGAKCKRKLIFTKDLYLKSIMYFWTSFEGLRRSVLLVIIGIEFPNDHIIRHQCLCGPQTTKHGRWLSCMEGSQATVSIWRGSFQVWDFHYNDKTAVRPSYLYARNPFTGKTTSLFWNGLLLIKAKARETRWILTNVPVWPRRHPTWKW